MGQTTPNIGIYVPNAGEDNYDQSFAAGMVNVDQHDHSGSPNKGVPITSSGLSDFSVTYKKLANDVADPSTGIGVSATQPNKLQVLGLLKNIYNLAPVSGFITKDGVTSHARTFQATSTIGWNNPDGVAGDPSAFVKFSGIFPVDVADGGTGLITASKYDILCGGTAATGPFQQVAGEGIVGQFLGSQGANNLPSWQDLPAQNFQIATLSLTAAQFTAITSNNATNVTLVPAAGPGTVIVVESLWAKLTFVPASTFGGGSVVKLYYGTTGNEVFFSFSNVSFKDNYTGYYYATNNRLSSSTGIVASTMENKDVTIGLSGASFTFGTNNTVSFSCQYSIMQI